MLICDDLKLTHTHFCIIEEVSVFSSFSPGFCLYHMNVSKTAGDKFVLILKGEPSPESEAV